MIRFSSRVKYGLQFMLFLCIDDEGFTGIQRAALSCDIPQKFLEAIAVDLKKNGLLEVKRGAGGGYRLAKPEYEITLEQIVDSLEATETKPDKKSGDLIYNVCDQLFENTVDEFRSVMSRITLDKVHRKYSDSADKLMYYI